MRTSSTMLILLPTSLAFSGNPTIWHWFFECNQGVALSLVPKDDPSSFSSPSLLIGWCKVKHYRFLIVFTLNVHFFLDNVTHWVQWLQSRIHLLQPANNHTETYHTEHDIRLKELDRALARPDWKLPSQKSTSHLDCRSSFNIKSILSHVRIESYLAKSQNLILIARVPLIKHKRLVTGVVAWVVAELV